MIHYHYIEINKRWEYLEVFFEISSEFVAITLFNIIKHIINADPSVPDNSALLKTMLKRFFNIINECKSSIDNIYIPILFVDPYSCDIDIQWPFKLDITKIIGLDECMQFIKTSCKTSIVASLENREEEKKSNFKKALESLIYALISEDFIFADNLASIVPDNEIMASIIKTDLTDSSGINSNELLMSIIIISRLALYSGNKVKSGKLWAEISSTNIIFAIMEEILKTADKYTELNIKNKMYSENTDTVGFSKLLPNIISKRLTLLKELGQIIKYRNEVTKKVKNADNPQSKLTSFEKLREGFRRHMNEYKNPKQDLNDVALLDPVGRFRFLHLNQKYTIGDGHCLFHALLQGANMVGIDPQTFIRELIQFSLSRIHPNQSNETTPTHFDNNQGEVSDEVINQLLNSLSLTSPDQQENWGGQEILPMVSSYFERAVLVIMADSYLSNSGEMAIWFEPEAEPMYLNLVSTYSFLHNEYVRSLSQPPIIIGFLQGDPNHGYGNHWFHVDYINPYLPTDSTVTENNSTEVEDYSPHEADESHEIRRTIPLPSLMNKLSQ